MTQEAKHRKQANNDFYEMSRVYHQSIPLSDIIEILVRHGFDPEGVHGIYTGRDGSSHDQVGDKTWMSMTWHRMDSGRWEVNIYLS
jgi:hypothetical protein